MSHGEETEETFPSYKKEFCLRTSEKFLRQKVQHPVDDCRRRKHLVRTEVGQAVLDIRTNHLDLDS